MAVQYCQVSAPAPRRARALRSSFSSSQGISAAWSGNSSSANLSYVVFFLHYRHSHGRSRPVLTLRNRSSLTANATKYNMKRHRRLQTGGDVFQEKSSEFTGKLLHTSFDTVERFLQNGVARGVAEVILPSLPEAEPFHGTRNERDLAMLLGVVGNLPDCSCRSCAHRRRRQSCLRFRRVQKRHGVHALNEIIAAARQPLHESVHQYQQSVTAVFMAICG